MAAIRRLEDIDAWASATELASEIYTVTRRGPWLSDLALRDQIRRAAVSAASNIAEGYGRKTNREFARFLDIARGSATEVQSLLYLAKNVGYLTDDAFRQLRRIAREVTAKITALANYLRR